VLRVPGEPTEVIIKIVMTPERVSPCMRTQNYTDLRSFTSYQQPTTFQALMNRMNSLGQLYLASEVKGTQVRMDDPL